MVIQVNAFLKELSLPTVITKIVLKNIRSKKGLHTNSYGVAKSAMNYSVTIKKFWKHSFNSELINAIENNIAKICPLNLVNDDCQMDAFALLKNARQKMSIVLIGHININSIRHKFDMPNSMVKDNIEVFRNDTWFFF